MGLSPEERGRTSTADEEAFQQFVVPEIETMLRVARTLTRDTGEAEDLVQDALVRAYRGIAGFDGRYPRAWLLTIVRNTHLNRLRRRRPELLADPDADLDRVARHTQREHGGGFRGRRGHRRRRPAVPAGAAP